MYYTCSCRHPLHGAVFERAGIAEAVAMLEPFIHEVRAHGNSPAFLMASMLMMESLKRLGHFQRAISVADVAIAWFTELNGPENSATLSLVVERACFVAMVDLPKGRALFKDLVPLHRRVLGANHPMTLMVVRRFNTLTRMDERCRTLRPLP